MASYFLHLADLMLHDGNRGQRLATNYTVFFYVFIYLFRRAGTHLSNESYDEIGSVPGFLSHDHRVELAQICSSPRCAHLCTSCICTTTTPLCSVHVSLRKLIKAARV